VVARAGVTDQAIDAIEQCGHLTDIKRTGTAAVDQTIQQAFAIRPVLLEHCLVIGPNDPTHAGGDEENKRKIGRLLPEHAGK
jgi:hypothetical protein